MSSVLTTSSTINRRTPVSRWLCYIAACLCTATSSGGLILGVGPFSSSLIAEGYITSDRVSTVFTGAFQIMTWGSIFAVHVESRLGPRFSAMIGACIQFAGHATLANLPHPTNPYYVMVAYGLLGWGGNHIFFSCFQFAQLFPGHIGLADGCMSGLFNLAGCLLLALNIPGMTIKLMFQILMGVEALVLTLIVVLWPDRSFRAGEASYISFPSLRYSKSIFTLAMYRRGQQYILNARYALYVLMFSWSCLVTQYVSGNLVLYVDSSAVGDDYLRWAYPLIANPTCLFSWSVGYAIDRIGFAPLAILQLIFAQVSLWCLYAQHSTLAAWVNLVCINWTCAIQYTIEFVFLHKVLPPEAFSAGLAGVLVVQGSLGFIANPGLSPNPWGEDYFPPIVGLSVLALPLLAWPVLECHWHRKRSTLDSLPPPSPQAGGAGFHSSVLVGLESPPASFTNEVVTSTRPNYQVSP